MNITTIKDIAHAALSILIAVSVPLVIAPLVAGIAYQTIK